MNFGLAKDSGQWHLMGLKIPTKSKEGLKPIQLSSLTESRTIL
jgi:hypothetical protein